MSNTKDSHRQPGGNSKRKSSTNPITRRGVVIGGTTALAAGLAAVGITKPDQASAQQPQRCPLSVL